MAAEKGAYFETSIARQPQLELRMTLYVHQVMSGAKQNQKVVVSGDNVYGTIAANDWTVFDGMGSGANQVGNAQGMHMKGSMTENSWNIYFDLVFKNGRFKGSTLKLLGSVAEEGQWAIVGGTGEFTLAQGIVSYKKAQEGNGMNIRELKFRVFYTPLSA